ncbi:EamA family transporter [archaeon]|nr:EamA family transporter [archaeon]
MKEEQKGFLFVIVSMTLSGFFGVASRLISINPLTILFFFQLTGAITLFIMIAARRQSFSPKDKIKLIFAMAVIITISDFAFFNAVRMTTIANAAFVKYMAPIFIIIFVPFLIKERFEKRSAYAIILAVIGLVLMLYQSGLTLTADLTGILLSLVTAITLALFIILIKNITKKVSTLVMTFYRFVFGTIILSPLFFTNMPMLNLNTLIVLVAFAITFAVIMTLIHMEGIKRIKAQHAGILGYMEPLSAAVFGTIIFSEVPTLLTLIGGLMILASVYFTIRKS